MFKRIFGAAAIAAAIAISLVAGRASAGSATHVLKASLDKKALPSVKDAGGASGTLTGKLTIAGKKSSFVWSLTFHHLSGTATRASIYFGTGSKAGTLALPLCVKCQAPTAHGAYIGPYVANATFVHKVLHGGAYVVVVTKKNPRGEIRGQIKATS
jgi:hypothetical protein